MACKYVGTCVFPGTKGLELAVSLPAHPPTLRDTPEDSLSGRLRTPGWRGRYFCRDKHGGGGEY